MKEIMRLVKIMQTIQKRLTHILHQKKPMKSLLLKKDKKLPNLMLPKKGKAGVTKFMRRKNLQNVLLMFKQI